MREIVLLDLEENTYMSAYLYFLRNRGIVKLYFKIQGHRFYLSFRKRHTISTVSLMSPDLGYLDLIRSWAQALAG
jgi:hypothetical protein